MMSFIGAVLVQDSVKVQITPTGVYSVSGFQARMNIPGVLSISEGLDTAYEFPLRLGSLAVTDSSIVTVMSEALDACVHFTVRGKSRIEIEGAALRRGIDVLASDSASFEAPHLTVTKRLRVNAAGTSTVRVLRIVETSMSTDLRDNARLFLE